jgi:hypothetical protein
MYIIIYQEPQKYIVKYVNSLRFQTSDSVAFSPHANYARLSAKLVRTFVGRTCRVVSASGPHAR